MSGNMSNVRTRLLDSGKGDVPGGRYHVIVSSMTFHHVEDPSNLMGQLYEALLPDGSLCITDLDLDNGMFHGDHTGVFHSGFERAYMLRLFKQQGLKDIRVRTAATVIKKTSDGSERAFTVFIASGRKT
jgi:2-polyprenyl-3-methyl-5-hydroxy-6-metoxy-1,4-benzoquinol methylase